MKPLRPVRRQILFDESARERIKGKAERKAPVQRVASSAPNPCTSYQHKGDKENIAPGWPTRLQISSANYFAAPVEASAAPVPCDDDDSAKGRPEAIRMRAYWRSAQSSLNSIIVSRLCLGLFSTASTRASSNSNARRGSEPGAKILFRLSPTFEAPFASEISSQRLPSASAMGRPELSRRLKMRLT